MGFELDENTIFMFIKFAREERYLTDLQKGHLYMNNGKYFIEREKQDGAKGIGDKYELSAVWNKVNLKFFKSGTDDLVLEGQAERFSVNYDYLLSKPIFCMTHISADSLATVTERKDSVDCQLNFNAEDTDQIVKDFGEHALVINPQAFSERVENSLEKMGITYLRGRVSYEDFGINSSNRLEAYHNHHPSLFFTKDLPFEHQREYRIVLTGVDSKEPYILDVGDISDISYLIPTRVLFSGKFLLSMSIE